MNESPAAPVLLPAGFQAGADSLGPRRPRAASRDRDVGLLYLVGLTLPFPELGFPLNEVFTLSITSLIGMLFACRRLGRYGLTAEYKAALVMIVVFAATAVARYPLSSYALSLAALGLALLPFANSRLRPGELLGLVEGLLLGMWLTLGLMALCILPQVVGAVELLGPLASWLVGTEQMGVFLGYIRPFAGFTEPSHLAIYLASVYVVLDLLVRAGWPLAFWRAVAPAAVLFTGSVAGLVLLVLYVFSRWAGALGRLLAGRFSMKIVMRGLVATAVLVALFLAMGPDPEDLFEQYALRVLKTLDDVETGNLVGSEGSRVNAVLALPDYWTATGLPGFLAGTGYANHKAWLIDAYGHLNESATFSRGAVDSILIAVFLSTGVFGLAAYLKFLAVGFGTRVLAAHMSLAVFVLAINFAYGYLIAGLYWQLLFVLAATARQCVLQETRPRRRRRVSGVRPQGRPLKT